MIHGSASPIVRLRAISAGSSSRPKGRLAAALSIKSGSPDSSACSPGSLSESVQPTKYHRQVFLTKHEAASFLRIGVRKLERLRAAGEGPHAASLGDRSIMRVPIC